MMTDVLGMKLSRLGIKYDEYLAGAHWQDVKRRYRASALPQSCLRCRSHSYCLHHTTYERLGSERLTDLAPLCHYCHEQLHEFDRAHPELKGDTARLLKAMCGWTRKHANKVFAPFRPPPKPRPAAVIRPARRKWQPRWMSGPLGRGIADPKGPRQDLIAFARKVDMTRSLIPPRKD